MFDQGIGLASSAVTEGRMLGLWYDPDRLIIEGVYCDEITAYRARKRWIEALKIHFLLDDGLDFSLRVSRLRGERHFKVQCSFLTACGRYAFWRLTHHQALEVQCILETAHLPRSLCTLSIDSLIDEVDFPVEPVRTEPRRERDSSCQSGRAWEKAVRSIQQLANRLVGVTRTSNRSSGDFRE
jgi:hypothetical protein